MGEVLVSYAKREQKSTEAVGRRKALSTKTRAQSLLSRMVIVKVVADGEAVRSLSAVMLVWNAGGAR